MFAKERQSEMVGGVLIVLLFPPLLCTLLLRQLSINEPTSHQLDLS